MTQQTAVLDEITLFEGDLAYVQSMAKVLPGVGIITDQRFVFNSPKTDSIVIRKDEIESAGEVKHGFAKKWEIKTRDGKTFHFQPLNAMSMRQAMSVLTGGTALGDVSLEGPPLSAVKNKTAWLAALGPTISSFVALAIWEVIGPTFLQIISMWIVKFVVMYLFLRIDYFSLQKQGYTPARIGMVSPESFWKYLFKRAEVFGQKKGYAYLWSGLLALEIGIAIYSYLIY